MFRVLPSYGGGVYDVSLVDLYNRFTAVVYPETGRLINVGDFRSMWFESSWFDPNDLSLIVIGDRVVGYLYKWFSRGFYRVNIRVGPSLPLEDVYRVIDLLLRVLKGRVLGKTVNSLVKIWVGYEYRFLYNVFRWRYTPLYIQHTATMMYLNLNRYMDVRDRIGGVENISIVRGGIDDLDKIVDIYNDAFSIYEWFYPWNIDDARRYYTSRKIILDIAYLGSKYAGYGDYEVYTNVRGERIGYIHTIAVKRGYQGRGVGTYITCRLIDELLDMDVDRIYLDSISGVEPFYYRIGFEPIVRSLIFVFYI